MVKLKNVVLILLILAIMTLGCIEKANKTTPTKPQTVPIVGWNKTWEYNLEIPIVGVSVSPEGGYIVTVGEEDFGNTSLYLLTKEKEVLWKRTDLGRISDVSISQNGEYIAVGTFSSEVYLLRKDGNLVWTKEDFEEPGIIDVSISSNGKYLAIGIYGAEKGYAYLFTDKGEKLWRYRTFDGVTDVDISEDGEFIVAGDCASYLYLLNKGGGLLWDKEATGGPCVQVSISPDGDFIGIGTGLATNQISILDKNGEEVVSPRKVPSGVWGVSIDSDGELIAVTVDEDEFYVYNRKDLIYTFKARLRVKWVDMTPDGNVLVAGSKDFRVYYLERGYT